MNKRYLLFTVFLLAQFSGAQIIDIPDANFKAKLLAANTTNTIAKNLMFQNIQIDTNNNGNIEVSEALEVYFLNVENSSIADMEGILGFGNLKNLKCNNNSLSSLTINNLPNLNYLGCDYNQISSLSLSNLPVLSHLECGFNQLSVLNVNNFPTLRYLHCFNNQISSLDVGNLTGLLELTCQNNQLSALDVNGLTNLRGIQCDNNQIPSLNLNGLTYLDWFTCNNNLFTALDFSTVPHLSLLWCAQNPISTLDVSGLSDLTELKCGSNEMTALNIKNGSAETTLEFSQSPNLEYICADGNQIDQVQGLIAQYAYDDCHVNTYCSFTPGGTFYTLQGQHHYDGNSNGCEASDGAVPRLKFNLSNGISSETFLTGDSASYSLDVQQGVYTLTPVLENPNYFTISPSTITVDFPSTASPFSQDFCLTANGVHADLEIVILPTVAARPGLDAGYKIIYRNKGTYIQSGTLNLDFDDAKMDLVVANPSAVQLPHNLSWNFANLAPFETRQIELTFNINSPLETPAVNGGDVLAYTAVIVAATDETPADNTFTLNQAVVNSFDPNDKACLEGTTILPENAGEYVHYKIRFENTGTANAVNIVVKDVIDAGKYEIASLVALDGSHDYVTRINGNTVEFIFENINLPFDDANNDGYVLFKIKTKPTLVLGDTLSNTASIYFDYNHPIVTEPAITTISALATKDFEFSDYFAVYPNPAANTLQIQSKGGIEMRSVSIYNVLGQQIVTVVNAQQTKSIDVSALQSGNYFLRIDSDQGSSHTQFVKK